jgi:hypothetical protein
MVVGDAHIGYERELTLPTGQRAPFTAAMSLAYGIGGEGVPLDGGGGVAESRRQDRNGVNWQERLSLDRESRCVRAGQAGFALRNERR